MEPVIMGRAQTGKRTRAVPVAYLPHKDEPTDNYEAYLVGHTKPTKIGHNLHNLFDDTDLADSQYFQAVRNFIRLKEFLSQKLSTKQSGG